MAKKIGEYEVDVPEWGIKLKTAQPVGDDIKAVGIRAHYFNPKTNVNCYPVEFLGGMEEPFEWIVEFRYKGQDKDSPNIWWRIPKDRLPNPYPTELGVVPINVLLLYK
jgi:molybdate transport system ATP-binding protein